VGALRNDKSNWVITVQGTETLHTLTTKGHQLSSKRFTGSLQQFIRSS